jgi:GT2 family glycosyltransferase
VDRLLGLPADAGETEPREVFGASAGAALYRRAMLHELEGFDESFFLYLEDVDVAWRARMRGWRCLYAPAAVAWHVHSGTAVHGSGFKHRLVGRNRIRLLAKNADGHQLRRHLPAIVAYELGYVLYAGTVDRTAAPLLGRLQGLRDWRSLRRAYAGERRPIPLARSRGVRAALRRRAVWLSAHRGSACGCAPN